MASHLGVVINISGICFANKSNVYRRHGSVREIHVRNRFDVLRNDRKAETNFNKTIKIGFANKRREKKFEKNAHKYTCRKEQISKSPRSISFWQKMDCEAKQRNHKWKMELKNVNCFSRLLFFVQKLPSIDFDTHAIFCTLQFLVLNWHKIHFFDFGFG